MRTPDPIDVLSRIAAMPLIVHAASMSAIERARRRWDRTDDGDGDERIGIVGRLSDEFFERVEERFRTRFTDSDVPPDAA